MPAAALLDGNALLIVGDVQITQFRGLLIAGILPAYRSAAFVAPRIRPWQGFAVSISTASVLV